MQYHDFVTETDAQVFLSLMQSVGFRGYIMKFNQSDFQVRIWK